MPCFLFFWIDWFLHEHPHNNTARSTRREWVEEPQNGSRMLQTGTLWWWRRCQQSNQCSRAASQHVVRVGNGWICLIEECCTVDSSMVLGSKGVLPPCDPDWILLWATRGFVAIYGEIFPSSLLQQHHTDIHRTISCWAGVGGKGLKSSSEQKPLEQKASRLPQQG